MKFQITYKKGEATLAFSLDGSKSSEKEKLISVMKPPLWQFS